MGLTLCVLGFCCADCVRDSMQMAQLGKGTSHPAQSRCESYKWLIYTAYW